MQTGQALQERELAQACVKGDLNAKKLLYETYSKKLFFACLQYAENTEEAEDIMHDAFIKIFNSLKTFDGRGSLEGWMRRITVNAAINNYHKKRRLVPIILSDEETKIVSTDDGDEQVWPNISQDELLEMIQQLAPRYKMVFNLYAIEGLSHKEISKELKISEGTSKSQLARARGVLQNLVSEKFNSMKDGSK